MFRLRRKSPKRQLVSKNCENPFLRTVLLFGLFAFTASAFWWNFERRMEMLNPSDGSHAIANADKILQKNELKKLYAWRDAFEKEWGIRVLIHAQAKELSLPSFPSSTLYVGVGILHGQASIVFPPLARKALGEGLRTVTEEQLAMCIKEKSAGTCLDTAMQSLWNGFE